VGVTSEEARASLKEMEEAARRSRNLRAYALGDVIYTTFGVITVVGSLATHLLVFEMEPPRYGAISPTWSGLLAVGIAVLIWVNLRRAPTRNRAQKRLGWPIAGFWLFLYAYVSLWLHLLMPFFRIGPGQGSRFCVRYGALSATIPMFAYVAMGLWLADKLIFAVGLTVTALTILTLVLLPAELFYVGVAAAVGGPLIGAGIACRLRMGASCRR